jgi:hypothetical protein
VGFEDRYGSHKLTCFGNLNADMILQGRQQGNLFAMRGLLAVFLIIGVGLIAVETPMKLQDISPEIVAVPNSNPSPIIAASKSAAIQSTVPLRERSDTHANDIGPDRAAIANSTRDAVAKAHGGVLPKTLSQADIKIALHAAATSAAKQSAENSKSELLAMKTKPTPRAGYGEIILAEEGITKSMRDPASVVFADVIFVSDRKSEGGYYVPVVCGSVNARNGFGGMSGPRHFVAVVSKIASGVWLEGTTSQKTLAVEWNRFCAGTHD